MKTLLNFFTLNNFIKIIIIFSVGFFSRLSLLYFYNLDVFNSPFNPFSISYYLLFSCFIVFINDLFCYIDLSFSNFLNKFNRIIFYCLRAISSLSHTDKLLIFGPNNNPSISDPFDPKGHSFYKKPYNSDHSSSYERPFTKFKSKVLWYTVEKHNSRFSSYDQFKSDFDPKTSLFSFWYKAIKDSLQSPSSDSNTPNTYDYIHKNRTQASRNEYTKLSKMLDWNKKK